MQKMKMIAMAICLLGVFTVAAPAQDTTAIPAPDTMANQDMAAKKSLYDRLGGLDAITAVIDEFIARVVADDRINKKFAKSDPKRLRLHLIEQVCAATGGPCVYTGLSMKQSHKNMKVTEGEFNALIEDLSGALDKFNVGATEKNELLTALAGMKGDIVEVNSPDTGAALPADFKPAKPAGEKELQEGPKMKQPGMMKDKKPATDNKM
ncbi:hypothetical protein BH18ACI2_BH18ACI2_21440 [soil metagenome]